MKDDEARHDYYQLSPDVILNAVESKGYACNGQLLALNSYENRVYQVGIHDQEPVIAKFYRPQRWSDAAIEEELAFSTELCAHEIPVIAPLPDEQNTCLFEYQDFRFALFPRYGGYSPQLDNEEHLKQLGRLIARI
ncbi:MAG: phosphotransferase, partial [Gammaproteobacteria bacterium]|nr:phosphotransferase [Gammaproteobacteria bacterium]